MTKQEKIKEAWGDKYEYWKPQEEGWSTIYHSDFKDNKFKFIDYNKFSTQAVGHGVYSIRPKSLNGLENNNGWNSIEDLDIDDDEYVLFLRYYEGEGEPPIFTCPLGEDFQIGYFTHWKRIDFEKPPLFS